MTKKMTSKVTPEMRFSAAFKAALEEAGMSQSELSRWTRDNHTRVIQQSAISNYSKAIVRNGRLFPQLLPADIFVFEVALGQPPGALSRHLGYVPYDGTHQ